MSTTECNCEAATFGPGAEHRVTCPTYEPPLTVEELRHLRQTVLNTPVVDHHPRCGEISVPDLLMFCNDCGSQLVWCGCKYRCTRGGCRSSE